MAMDSAQAPGRGGVPLWPILPPHPVSPRRRVRCETSILIWRFSSYCLLPSHVYSSRASLPGPSKPTSSLHSRLISASAPRPPPPEDTAGKIWHSKGRIIRIHVICGLNKSEPLKPQLRRIQRRQRKFMKETLFRLTRNQNNVTLRQANYRNCINFSRCFPGVGEGAKLSHI